MSPGEDAELERLRARAFRRDADIADDPIALARLRELEALRVPSRGARQAGSSAGEVEDADALSPTASATTPGTIPDADVGRGDEGDRIDPPTPAERVARVAIALGRRIRRLRRSTVLATLGALALVACLVTALVLVQRVQGDPLLQDAKQVARLSPVTGYDIPVVLVDQSASSRRVYEPYQGLRALTYRSSGAISTSSDCLLVFADKDGDDTAADSFDLLFGGCSAGRFPASALIPGDSQNLPAALRADLPRSAALDFVYDAEHDEVVVFTDR